MISRYFITILTMMSGMICYPQTVRPQSIYPIDSLQNVLDTTADNSSRVIPLLKLSEYMTASDYPMSKELAIEAVQTARKAGCEGCLSRALTHLGVTYWIDAEYESAHKAYQEALALYTNERDSLGIAISYHKIGLIYYYTSDFEKAIEHYKKALDIYLNIRDTLKTIGAYTHIGLILETQGKYPESVDFLLRSTSLKMQLDRYPSGTYNVSGVDGDYNKNYYRRELDLHLQKLAEEDWKENSNEIALANTYHAVGMYYYYLEKYDSALFHLKKSSSMKGQNNIIMWWNDLAKAYRRLDLLDSAIYYHQLGLQTYKEKGTRINMMASYGTLGDTYLEAGDPENALESYTQALKLNEAAGHRQTMASLMRKMANTYLLLGDPGKAQALALQSLELSESIGAIKNIRRTLEVLVNIYEDLGNFEASLYYMNRYKVLNDSIASGESRSKLAQLQLQYDFDRQGQELELSRQQNQISSAKLLNRNILVYSISIGFLLVLLLAVSAYRRNILKQKINRYLEKSNREKEVLLAEIHHRVKNNLQIVSSLLSIQSLQLEDHAAIDAVKESQNRVQAMGLIHESLYKHKDFKAIDMQEYLQHLCLTIIMTFGYNQNTLKLQVDAGSISLDLDSAIPLGLITNELVSNSLKHAFSGTKVPEINVLLKEKEDELCLSVQDNGDGISQFPKESSFGLELVKGLAKKLEGTIDIENSGGLKICVMVKNYKIAA